jgi:hypothetical protein
MNLDRQKHIYLAAILFSIVILISCSPQSCFEETEAYLKVSFYNNTTKKLQAPDSLTLYGINSTTFNLYNKAKNVQPALLPLNSSTENCKFIIRINGITDTLDLSYTNYPHLISKECGLTFYHTLDTIIHTKNTIDYIYYTRKNITTINEENIRIFY